MSHDIQNFEKICRERGLTPKGKFSRPWGDVYVAEGYDYGGNPNCPPGDPESGANVLTHWILARDGKVKVMQDIVHPMFAVPYQKRIDICINEARAFIGDA